MDDVDSIQDISLVEEGFRKILSGLGLQWRDDPHLRDTPSRAARAWFHELFRGVTGEPPSVTTFPKDGEKSSLILLRNIPVRSFCSHHILPFIGTATVGYIPGGDRILGLSKLSRIVNFWARRPQVQERLTDQIADDIWERVHRREEDKGPVEIATEGSFLTPENTKGGVGVVIKARHMCMELRGVEHEGEMVTSALRGVLFDRAEARAEFLSLAKKGGSG